MHPHSGKLLIEALDKLWRQYRKQLKACRKSQSEDNIHELRVSTRRLIALIELLHTLQPQPLLRRIRKALKSQLDGFDELRDTQVMLFEAAKTIPTLPELAAFLAFMHGREQQLLHENKAHIANIYHAKLPRKIKKAAKRFKSDSAESDLNTALPAAIDALYGVVMTRYQALDSADLASIHHLRIAAKKFRYSLTSMPTILLDTQVDYLKKLQNYCALLGDIQNSSILLQTLEAFFKTEIPEDIQRHYQAQQQSLLAAFKVHQSEVLSFKTTLVKATEMTSISE